MDGDKKVQAEENEDREQNDCVQGNKNAQAATDGGYSWVILACTSTLMFLNQLGIATFGVYIIEFREQFRDEKAMFAVMYAANITVSGLAGIVSGPLVRIWSLRLVGIIGVLISTGGYIMCSFSTNIQVLVLAYGLFVGLGISFVDMAANVGTHQYFDKKRGFANSILISSTALTIFVAPPLVDILINHYGWRGAFLLQSGAVLNGLPVSLLLRPFHSNQNDVTHVEGPTEISQVKRAKCHPILNCLRQFCVCHVLRNIPFVLIEIGCLCYFMAEHTPLMFTVSRAVQLGISRGKSAFIMSVWAVGSICGELGLGWVGDRVQRVPMLAAAVFGGGIVNIISVAFSTHPLQLTYGALYGLMLGGYYAMKMPALVDVVGIENLPAAHSINLAVGGVSGIVGPILSDLIAEKSGNFNVSFSVAGVVMMVGGALIFVAALYDRCRKKCVKSPNSAPTETLYMQVKTEDAVIEGAA